MGHGVSWAPLRSHKSVFLRIGIAIPRPPAFPSSRPELSELLDICYTCQHKSAPKACNPNPPCPEKLPAIGSYSRDDNTV